MKSFFLLILIFPFAAELNSQTYQYQWTKRMNGVGFDADLVWMFVSDNEGDLYGMGDSFGTVTFGDTTFSTSAYNSSTFKISSSGELIWLQSSDFTESASIAVDENKKCYNGGWFGAASASFPPFTIFQTAGVTGNSSYYTTLDSNGIYTSAAKIFSGNSFSNAISGVICNASGDVAYNDRREQLIGFSYVSYSTITKKNAAGGVWTKAFTTTDVKPMHIDELNNLYLKGNYTSAITIDGTTLTNSGETDSYIAKLNSIGTYQWIKNIGGNHNDWVTEIKTDDNGNTYIGGFFNSDSVDFGGIKLYGEVGENNSFIAKINPAGNFIWAITLDQNANHTVSEIYFDFSNSQLIIAGSYTETITIGPDVLSVSPGKNIFIATIDTNGIKLNATQIILPSTALALCTTILSGGSVGFSGYFSGTAVFGDTSFTAFGSGDGFITKISFCNEGITSYFDNDGDGFGNAAISSTTCSVPPGYVINSTDCNDANNLIYPCATEICNTVDDDCDVIIDEDLITAGISPSGPTTFCKGSNVVLNANTGIGYLFQWKKNGVNIAGATGANYTATKTGDYTVFITIPGGCSDISDITHLVVNPVPTASINNLDGTNNLCVDASIKLKANGGAGYTYQWYKGATPLAGATTQIYFASITGNFKVFVTNASGCSKMSAAVSIINACKGPDQSQLNHFEVFPNPNSGNFSISGSFANQKDGFGEIIIRNILGEIIYSAEISIATELNTTIQLSNTIPPGIYLLTLNFNGLTFTKEIILTE